MFQDQAGRADGADVLTDTGADDLDRVDLPGGAVLADNAGNQFQVALDRQVQNGPPKTTRSTSRALVMTETARATSTAERSRIPAARSSPS